jgi:hypothetical protein
MTQQTEVRDRLLVIVATLPPRDQEYYLKEVNRLPSIIAEMTDTASIQDNIEGCQLQIAMQQWLAAEFQARLMALAPSL